MKCSTLLGSFLLLAPLSATVAAEGAFHDMSFEAALEAAKKEEKLVFVDFYTTWCGPCKQLDAVTWKDEAVIDWLKENTIALKIDAEKETELASKYKVQAYPSMIFIEPDGSEKGRILGYKGPKDFLEVSADTLAGISRADRVRINLEKAGGLDTMLRFELGRELLQEGDHEGALEQLIWCWDHGIDHEQGFSGVRSSYLLSDLGRLAKAYPPAREALVTRRDACAKAVIELTEDAMAAGDLATLNEHLREQEKTLATYDAMALPEGADETLQRRFERNRRALFESVLDALLEQRRYAEIVETVGDPLRNFESRLAVFQSDGPANDAQANMANVFRRKAIVEGAKHYEALLGAERAEEAQALADAIVTVDAEYGTYKLLVAHAARSGNGDEADRMLLEAKGRVAEKYHRRLERARKRG